MGVMRFAVYPPELLDEWPEVYRAFISGFDERIFPTRIEVDDNVITCRRQESESGKLNVAWPVAGVGRPIVSTCSLAEREEPYLLSLELARGKIAQLRDQAESWKITSLKIPDEFQSLYSEALRLFTRALSLQSQNRLEESSQSACDAVQKACEAAALLVEAYSQQRLNVRRRRSPQLPASLGCFLGFSNPDESRGNDHFCEAFHAAAIPVEWKCARCA